MALPGTRTTWPFRIVGVVRNVVNVLVVIIFAYMVVAVILQVASRTLTWIPAGNAVETATFAQIWLTTLGAGLALRQGALFALDTVTRRLHGGIARALSLLIAAIGLGFIAVMIYGGVLLTMQGMAQNSPVLQLPMWTMFISIPIGMTLLGLEVIVHLIERWDDPFAAPVEEIA